MPSEIHDERVPFTCGHERSRLFGCELNPFGMGHGWKFSGGTMGTSIPSTCRRLRRRCFLLPRHGRQRGVLSVFRSTVVSSNAVRRNPPVAAGWLFVRRFSCDAVVGVIEALQNQACQVPVANTVDDVPALPLGGDQPTKS